MSAVEIDKYQGKSNPARRCHPEPAGTCCRSDSDEGRLEVILSREAGVILSRQAKDLHLRSVGPSSETPKILRLTPQDDMAFRMSRFHCSYEGEG